jgi:hypothetical protein
MKRFWVVKVPRLSHWGVDLNMRYTGIPDPNPCHTGSWIGWPFQRWLLLLVVCSIRWRLGSRRFTRCTQLVDRWSDSCLLCPLIAWPGPDCSNDLQSRWVWSSWLFWCRYLSCRTRYHLFISPLLLRSVRVVSLKTERLWL